MKIAVITISDRAYLGEYQDLSGPRIEQLISLAYPEAIIGREIVPDEADHILKAFQDYQGYDFIITTGGTGISPRDITPEVSRTFCDKELPGISEAIRSESIRETKNAMLSRAYAGMKENTILINLPGSVKAVETGLRVILPVLEHAERMLRGEGH